MMKKRIAAMLRRTATRLDPPHGPVVNIQNFNLAGDAAGHKYAEALAKMQQAAMRETFNR